MCGIAGVTWTAPSSPIDLETLRRMTDVLSHRGPDDAGYYHSTAAPRGLQGTRPYFEAPHLSDPASLRIPAGVAGCALGQRRLSIIDLAGGHQPLCNEDGSIWISFNGEIYNYHELQANLERQGHRFRTSSDTEAIVHLYEQHGTACVDHLRGMFAFAIWDNRRRELFMARDRIGKKPLVYRHEPDRLLFASELKSLLQVPGVPREIDPVALDEYLTYQYVPHPHCILRGFQKLPPAHWALYRGGQLELHRYWKPAFEPGAEERHSSAESNGRSTPGGVFESYADAQRQLRETLTEAVRLRLRSDVPLGAFLSGGIDSTIIAGIMQSLSPRKIKTFSIGFPVKAFDERSYARQAAEHLRTEHHEKVVEPQALEILPKLIWHYDEPFADSSAIPTMYLSQMTRKHVTVALSGDGGDELFAGYERYWAVKIGQTYDRLPAVLRRAIAVPLWQNIPVPGAQRSKRRKVKRLISALRLPPERRYLNWISIFEDFRLRKLYDHEWRDRLGGFDAAEFVLAAYRECPSRDLVTRTMCADVLSYLPCDILTKVDIASMAYGLEARCPFLDQEVIQLAARMPVEYKMPGRKGKKILIETFADLLPPQIQRRSKMGFGVPLSHWFRHELRDLMRDVLLDPATLNRGYFRKQAVEELISEHLDERWDHSARLWSLLVFELWQRTYLDAAVPPISPVPLAARV
jgi:asparagine synthase (glutamine-hydrolysing)